MASPKRYSSGVTNVGDSTALSDFPTMAPNKVRLFFDDFDFFSQSSALTKHAFGWVVTSGVGAGVASVASDGGVICLNSTADGGYAGIQTQESFIIESGKKMWCGGRMKTAEATDMGYKIGISDIETDFAPAAAGCWFAKADTVTTIVLQLWDGGVIIGSTASLKTCTTSWITMEWYFDGVQTFHAYIDGVWRDAIVTDALPADVLTPWVGQVGGAAHATTNKAWCDFIYVAKER